MICWGSKSTAGLYACYGFICGDKLFSLCHNCGDVRFPVLIGSKRPDSVMLSTFRVLSAGSFDCPATEGSWYDVLM